MVTKIDGYVFDYDVVNKDAMDRLMKAPGIDPIFISNEGVSYVREVLDLGNTSYREDNLRAIRNSVVVGLNDRMREELGMDDDGETRDGSSPDYGRMRDYSTIISAVTSVIDNELWKRGYAV